MIGREDQQKPRQRTEPGLITKIEAEYDVRVSYELEDREWDAFLAGAPGGHHTQTSLWAQVKAVLGGRVARFVVTRRGRIEGGAQVLIRPLWSIGTVGYVPRGPLFTSDDPLLTKLGINELHKVARANRLQVLFVQPPGNGQSLARELTGWGFCPSSVAPAPEATVLVDLTQDRKDILARMKSTTRRNVRLGQRKGVRIREGTESDLSIFYRIVVATGQRQNFSLFPEHYFLELWRVFGKHGYVKLFLVDYEGETVSALLAIAFGNTVLYKMGGWSGLYGGCRPNEAMHWAAMMWAKSQGYHYYDLEGIDPKIATAIVQGRPLGASHEQTVTSFKLGFGGQTVLFPETYAYVYNPILRWAYRTISPKITRSPMVKRTLNRLRTR